MDPTVAGLRGWAHLGSARDPSHPTGLDGVFEAYCPPHYRDMRAAVEAYVERKFGPSGPYDPRTPGLWSESARVGGGAQRDDEHFVDCVATMAQHVLDTYGKFPGTVRTLFIMNFLPAHHLELAFYDRYFEPGAYLETRARQLERWH